MVEGTKVGGDPGWEGPREQSALQEYFVTDNV